MIGEDQPVEPLIACEGQVVEPLSVCLLCSSYLRGCKQKDSMRLSILTMPGSHRLV